MKNFDWNAFGKERNKIAVHCKTEEEAIDFCKQSHEHGYDWINGQNREGHTNWENGSCESGICYSYDCYSNVIYYNHSGYTILQWVDYMATSKTKTTFTKSDLKDGDFVLRRNGQVEVAIPSIGVYINERGFNYTDENDNDFNFPSKFKEDEWDIMEVRRPMKPCECQFSIFEFNWGEIMFKREKPVEMTLEEVCEALGKKIKIVEG